MVLPARRNIVAPARRHACHVIPWYSFPTRSFAIVADSALAPPATTGKYGDLPCILTCNRRKPNILLI